MRSSNAEGHPLTVIATLALLAGCSGSSSLAPAPLGPPAGAEFQQVQQRAFQADRFNSILRSHGVNVSDHRVTSTTFFNPAANGKPLIFVSDDTKNVVSIFLQAGKNKMVGQITGLAAPTSLATDAAGDLYVVNFYDSDVLVYAPRYTKAPKLVLDDPRYLPSSVAVSPQGVVGVVYDCTAPSCNSLVSNVSLYSKNSATPCATIVADPTTFSIESEAFDHKGNLYLTAYDSNSQNGVFGKITGGCKAKSIEMLTTANTIHAPLGIQIDMKGRIAILDDEYVDIGKIYTYNPPTKGSLGNPIATISLTGGPSFEYITEFAFLTSGHDLYAAFVGGGNYPGAALEYDYPAGGNPEDALTLPAPANGDGVAVTPPLIP